MTALWIISGFFLFVMGAVTATGYLFVVHRTEDEGSTNSVPGLNTDSGPFGTSAMSRALEALGGMAGGSISKDDPVRRHLLAAGYGQPSALHLFHGLRLAAALTFCATTALITIIVRGDVSATLVAAMAGAAFGYLLPAKILSRRMRERQQRLTRGLPIALDLYALSLDAGQTLDQAILETSRGVERSSPELSAELEQVFLETRASHDRSGALRNFALRTDEPEIRKVVTLLTDVDRFGTSVVPALRNHAKYLRLRMRQSAHEAARKVGVKLIFPVFFLIFPSVLLITLGPACIMVFTQLSNLIGAK